MISLIAVGCLENASLPNGNDSLSALGSDLLERAKPARSDLSKLAFFAFFENQ